MEFSWLWRISIFVSAVAMAQDKVLPTFSTLSPPKIANDSKNGPPPEKQFQPKLSFEPVYEDTHASSVSSAGTIASSVMAWSPTFILDAGEKKALEEYLVLLGVSDYKSDYDVRKRNNGIEGYFKGMWESDQCFQERALNFYKDVGTELRKYQPRAEDPNQKTCDFGREVSFGCPGDRPKLSDRAGHGTYSAATPGWLWRLALKHANGNKNLAFHFIGLCGSDDVTQTDIKYLDRSGRTQLEIQDEESKWRKHLNEHLSRLKEASANADSDPITYQAAVNRRDVILKKIDELHTQKGKERRFSCPTKNSAFYVPGNLGDGIDIDNSLRGKINRVQNPTGTEILPAKHYHVLGSAFMTCKLISDGLEPGKAVKIQTLAARAYRGIRMCSALNAMRSQNEKLLSLVPQGQNADDYVAAQVGTYDSRNQVCPSKEKFCPVLREIFGDAYKEGVDKPDVLRRKLKNWAARVDAAELYRDWYFGARTKNRDVLCTDKRMAGPKDLMNPNADWRSKILKPRGWNPERYEAASRQLATWDVDFEWTVSQHKTGAQFAAQQCPRGKGDGKPMTVACKDTTPPPPNSPASSSK